MNIIQAIRDTNLFHPFLADDEGDISTWANWMVALRVLYGLPVEVRHHELIRHCTGRDPALLPGEGFDTALFLTGRRSGKSRVAATVGAFEGAISGREARLAKGEKGLVAVVSPTVKQSRIVHQYIRAIFDATPMLRSYIVGETKEAGFELRNGVRIEMLAGDYRSIRGYTLLCAVIDEAAFFGLTDESKIRSDTELIRAIAPGLATTGGPLVAISSPYSKRGWTWDTHRKNFGNDAGRVLVFNCGSRVLNPTLPQAVIDAALAEDKAAAEAEYLGRFREDVDDYVPRHVIEGLVTPGRKELAPEIGVGYSAFVDMSGGRSDDAVLAIAHRAGRKVVLDCLRRYKPPFSPHVVIGEMAGHVGRYSCRMVVGDNYAAEFTAQAFADRDVRYTKSEKNKSQLYLELLPRLCSGEIELLDQPDLIHQLASLERRTRSGGRDSIDHPPGGHDDLANAVAGVADICATRMRRVGALFT